METLTIRERLDGAIVPDSYLFNTSPNTNYGTSTSFFVGATNVTVNPPSIKRGIISFDIPLDPGSARITSATLRLISATGAASAQTANVHRVTQTAWTESGVTWNDYDTSMSWSSAGGDFDSTVEASFSLPTAGSQTVDITGLESVVQDAVDSDGEVHLLIKRSIEAIFAAEASFFSSEIGAGSRRPQLIIEYIPIQSSGLDLFIQAHDVIRGGAKIYYGSDDINQCNIDGSDQELLVSTSGSSQGLYFDRAERIFYYGAPFVSGIRAVNYDGSNDHEIISLGGASIGGLSVHEPSGQIFWTEPLFTTVKKANLDGSDIVDITPASGADQPSYIAVDEINNRMYWTNPDFATIYRSDLDGNNVHLIDSGSIGIDRPQGIAVDPDNNYIFVLDGSIQRITRYDLDGNNKKIILDPDPDTFEATDAIALDREFAFVYYAIISTDTILRTTHQGDFIQDLSVSLDATAIDTLFVDNIGGLPGFISGKDLASSGLDLFISGPGLSSDDIDLYINGLGVDNQDLDLFIHGKNIQSGSLDLFINTLGAQTQSLDLFIQGFDTIEDSIALFINGSQLTSNDLNLFIDAFGVSTQEIDLFIRGIDSSENDLTLFINGFDLINQDLNLVINGVGFQQDDINLFINGSASSNNSIDLFINGIGNVNNNISLFITSIEPESSQIDLLILGSDQNTDDIDLFVEGLEVQSGLLDLFIQGQLITTSGLDLFTLAKDTAIDDLNLFIPGFASTSGNISLLISGPIPQQNQLNLFIDGSGIIPINNSITLLIVGITGLPPVICPELDPNASIQIRNELIQIYQGRIDALINQLGKNITLQFDDQIDECPNCLVDYVRGRSRGIYKSGGPRPFSRGRICPWCKGSGLLRTNREMCIKGLIAWDSRDAIDYGINVARYKAIVRIKTFLSTLSDLMRARFAIIDIDKSNLVNLKTQLIRSPFPVGLREDRYCISFWELV